MVVDYQVYLKPLTTLEFEKTISEFKESSDTYVNFSNVPNIETIIEYSNWAGQCDLQSSYDTENNILTVKENERNILKQYYTGIIQPQDSDRWYDCYYAISQTFKQDEVDALSDNELANLIKLAVAIQGALY